MTQSVVETETLSYSWLPYHTDDNCCLSLSLLLMLLLLLLVLLLVLHRL